MLNGFEQFDTLVERVEIEKWPILSTNVEHVELHRKHLDNKNSTIKPN